MTFIPPVFTFFRFEGRYEGNQPNGEGVLTFVNGTQFLGSFKNGKFHGSGKLVTDEGQLLQEGQWAEGVFKEEEKTE